MGSDYLLKYFYGSKCLSKKILRHGFIYDFRPKHQICLNHMSETNSGVITNKGPIIEP